jgi:hypothetical protein
MPRGGTDGLFRRIRFIGSGLSRLGKERRKLRSEARASEEVAGGSQADRADSVAR